MELFDLQRGTTAAMSERVANRVMSGFGQVCFFVVVGPPIGLVTLVLSQAGKSGNGFDLSAVLVMLFFSYVVGGIPAILSGCVFVPLHWAGERLLGGRVIRLLAAPTLGAMAGWVSGNTYLLLWNAGSLTPAILRGSVVASAVCALLVALWLNRR
jgi:hypothetical protein